MKKFIFSALCVSVFFVGLGMIVEKVAAKFKSDDKALSLIKAARTAIGGDNSIAAVQSLRIKGNTTHVWKIDGTERSEPGETEIAIQLPDKLSKMVKIGNAEGDNAGAQLVQRHVETVVVGTDKDGNQTFGRGEGRGTGIGTEPGTKVVIIKRGDGEPTEFRTEGDQTVVVRKGGNEELSSKTENGETRNFKINREEIEARHKEMRQNELARLTLGLLLSPPAGIEPNYTFGGETDVDGTPCNLVVAELGGPSVRLYLSKSSNLPVVLAYEGEAAPMMVRFNKETPAPGDGNKDVIFFRHADGPEASGAFQLRFSDYRSVGGVQLPYRWTTTGGDMREEFDVTSYEVNPSDIGNSFPNQNQKVMVRTKKEGQ